MYLTVFQANSSCQDKALADLPDGVCVSEMCTQRNKCETPWVGVKCVLIQYIISSLSGEKKKMYVIGVRQAWFHSHLVHILQV